MALLNPNSPPYFLTPPPLLRFYYYYIPPFNVYYIRKPIEPNYYTFMPTRLLLQPPPPPPLAAAESAVPAKERQNFSVKKERPVTVYWKPRRHLNRCSWKLQKRKPALPPAEFEFGTEEAALGDREWKTTVMIKNIPNCFGKKKVVELLDKHCLEVNQKLQIEGSSACKSEFDFLYLPMDFWSGCNLGYAFVNFTSPVAAWRLFHALHQKSWDSTRGSRKICEVTYARIQGLPALLGHFKDSIFACASEEYLPVRFVPSHDGERATEQQHIGKHIPRVAKAMV